MIQKIRTANPVNQEIVKNHNKQQKNNQVSFKSTMILDIAEKFKPIEKKILAETGVNPDTRVKDLTEDELQKIKLM